MQHQEDQIWAGTVERNSCEKQRAEVMGEDLDLDNFIHPFGRFPQGNWSSMSHTQHVKMTQYQNTPHSLRKEQGHSLPIKHLDKVTDNK